VPDAPAPPPPDHDPCVVGEFRPSGGGWRSGRVWKALFGAEAQVVIGALCLAAGAGAWVYGATLSGEALLRLIFHVSMFYGLVACYAIIATGLGYRATERVEAHVQNADVDVEVKT
jgi:hypothetical protein